MEGVQNRIKELRTAKGLSREKLAELTGIGYSTIWRYEMERNKAALKAPYLQKIATALSCTVSELLGEQPISNVSQLDKTNILHIPLVSPVYKVCAGNGNCYEDMPLEFEGTHELNDPQISALYSEDGLIAMKVEGDSMIGKRIYDGDTVIFDKSHDWVTGNICLVCLDGLLMIKGLISQGNNNPPILRSANPEYKDIPVSTDSQFAVLGRLVTVDPKNFNPGSII